MKKISVAFTLFLVAGAAAFGYAESKKKAAALPTALSEKDLYHYKFLQKTSQELGAEQNSLKVKIASFNKEYETTLKPYDIKKNDQINLETGAIERAPEEVKPAVPSAAPAKK